MLATCIMPTHNRRGFVPRAIELFLGQDLSDLELVILDDGSDAVRDCVPDHPRVRYLHSAQKLTVGEKRNLLCKEARGEFILHWDDDDWYPAWRARVQVAALARAGAQVCGSSTVYYRDAAKAEAWRYFYCGSRPYVTGNTMAYRRSFWQRTPFCALQVGEDARFVAAATRAELVDLARPDLCVASIHAANVSPKRPGGLGWCRVSESELSALLEKSQQALPDSERVSCIMPTRNRPRFVALALEAFAAQTLESRELLVVDDGELAVEELCRGQPGVKYLRLPRRLSIGTKRNLACRAATGALIAHWDDDDWYGPERLAQQLAPIQAGKADITGLINRFTLSLADQQFWALDARLHSRMFEGDVHGGTLVYRRSLLARGASYPELDLAEDALLLRALTRQGARLARVENDDLFVYMRHGRNAWRFEVGKHIEPAGWRRSERPARMPAAIIERYRAAASDAVPLATPAKAARLRDCFDAGELEPPAQPLRAEYCVAVTASDAQARLLDALLGSLSARGELPAEALRVVFVPGPAPAATAIARKHGATVLSVHALRAPSAALKGLLYMLPRFVQAQRYLCLDVDLLVLESLQPLLTQHALPAGQLLVAPECTRIPLTLGAALHHLYLGRLEELDLPAPALARIAAFPHVVNDGLFVADAPALCALDKSLRALPQLSAWLRARPGVTWRQKAALNLALALGGGLCPLDATYNVQLHAERVEAQKEHGRWSARVRGQTARVLHFNGGGRAQHGSWSARLLGSEAHPQV